MKTNNTVNVIGALLVGALAGAALGILFAPRKGSKTRNNILDGAKEMAHEVKKKMKREANVINDKVNKIKDSAKEKVQNMTESSN